jgi:hypothetical protein
MDNSKPMEKLRESMEGKREKGFWAPPETKEGKRLD